MIHEVIKKDLWEADVIADEKDHFEVDIKKCLWHDACVENGCPEICKYFCECDDVIYADLKRMEFKRKNTIGRGGSCCDFCYYKNFKFLKHEIKNLMLYFCSDNFRLAESAIVLNLIIFFTFRSKKLDCFF
jgi:hypothetical protein